MTARKKTAPRPARPKESAPKNQPADVKLFQAKAETARSRVFKFVLTALLILSGLVTLLGLTVTGNDQADQDDSQNQALIRFILT